MSEQVLLALLGAALTILTMLGGAMLKMFFSHSARLTKLETHAEGQEALRKADQENTKSTLARIENAARRVEDKVDGLTTALIKQVTNAVSQQG